MDAPLLYKASEHLAKKLIWLNSGPNEWTHFGKGQSAKVDLLRSEVSKHLNANEIYFVDNRRNSCQTTINDIPIRLDNLGNTDRLFLWDLEFSKAVEINGIGIFRKGEIKK